MSSGSVRLSCVDPRTNDAVTVESFPEEDAGAAATGAASADAAAVAAEFPRMLLALPQSKYATLPWLDILGYGSVACA